MKKSVFNRGTDEITKKERIRDRKTGLRAAAVSGLSIVKSNIYLVFVMKMEK